MKKYIGKYLWILAICSFLGVFASIYWVFDLFNHFRPNALIASVLFCGLTLYFDKRLLMLALTVTCLNAVLMAVTLWTFNAVPKLDPPNAEDTVNILSANVLTSNTNYQKALRTFAQSNPDVIALTETNEDWIQNLSALKETHPYTILLPRPDNFGMAVFSRLPFDAEIVPLGEYKVPLAVVNFDNFQLIVAHPLPPVSTSYMQDNSDYIKAVAGLASKTDGPVIVAGDMNSTIYARSIKPIFQAGLERVKLGLFSYTWPVRLPLFGIQIDHFFAVGVSQASGQVLSSIGSDHYPIQAFFKLR